MQWLAEICVRRPVLAVVLSLVLTVLGFGAYRKLGVDRFPNIDLPFVAIQTALPGGSATDMETEVTDRIEAAVNTIGGIRELRSTSAEGISLVYVGFELEKSVDGAAQEVRDKVATITRDLPEGTKAPVVIKADPGASPIVYVGVKGDGFEAAELADLTERLVVRRLEAVNGVGEARLLGAREREFQVIVDPLRLLDFNISAPEVANAISTQNLTMPGGRAEMGAADATVRVIGRAVDADELGNISIREVNNRIVRLRDVARVVEATAEPDGVASFDGDPIQLVVIRKQSGTNTVKIAEKIHETLEDVNLTLPKGMSVTVLRDESVLIKTSTDAVTEHLILGSLLAALVVLVFLGNFRSTLIAAVAIPISVIATFALMKMVGYTLNLITLLALALAVGIVIDDAIVVLENIWRFIEEKRMKPMQAAVEATEEIGMAVLATTISLVAVFIPIAFIAGIPGRFLASFGITMSFSIVVSLFVSFTLTPMLASRWLKLPKEGHKKNPLERLVDVFYRPIERLYMVLLRFAMRFRWLVMLAALATLMSVPFIAKHTSKGFLPRNDTARFDVAVRAPEGSSIAQTEIYAERIAAQIRKLDHVRYTMTTIGEDEARTSNLAHIYVQLVPPSKRPLRQDQMMAVVRDQVLSKVPKEIRAFCNEVPEISGGGQSSAAFQYMFGGPNLATLEAYVTRVTDKLRKYPGAVDLDTTMIAPRPEIEARIDRDRAADMGVRTRDIAAALNLLVGGTVVSNISVDGETVDVRLRAEPNYRADAKSMALLTVPSASGRPVRLSDVVEMKQGAGATQINRVSRQRQVTVMANPASGYSDGDIRDRLEAIMKEDPMPDGVFAMPTGRTREMKAVGESFVTGLLLAMIFVYLVLAAQFESWVLPISIISSLPLTLPFAMISVNVLGQSLDMFSMLGIFVLFGVVKKNGILQVDHTETLRRHGMPRAEAILQANKDRLRPILMTTVAFVAGMIPLITASGEGAGYSQATAGVIVGGQVLALLLTLLATPVMYSYLDDFEQFIGRMWRRFSGPTDNDDEGGVPQEKKEEEEDVAADLLVMLLALFVAGGAAMTLMPAAAAAEEPGAISSVSGGLTPDQAAELAVNASASLKALKAQEAAAEFTVKVAQLAYAPQVDVTANAFKLSEIEIPKSDVLSVGIVGADAGLITSLDGKALVAYSSAYQPLAHAMTLKATMVVPITDYLTRIRLYVAQAESTQDLSAQETAAAKARIGFGARAAYWQWVAAQAQGKVAASGLELAKAFKQVAERRVAAESAPQVDIVTADARIAAAEMQVVQSEAMVSIATDALRILIGDDARELSIGQLPATAAGEEPEAMEPMLARAYLQRPEIKALEAAIEVQRKGVTLAGLGLFPRLDLLGDITHANPNQRAFPPKDAFNTTWSMGVQLSWSPNSAAASDPLEQRAAAQLSVLEAKRETLRNEIRTSVVTARSHVLESEGALRATKAGLAAMTEANRLRAAAYAAGKATSLEVLDAQSQLISSQIQSWLAATRYEMAVEELRFAVGDAR